MGGWYKLFCLTSQPVPSRPQGLPSSRLLRWPPSPLLGSVVQRESTPLQRPGGRGHGGCVAVPTHTEDLH